MDAKMRSAIEGFARIELENNRSASWLLSFGAKYLAIATEGLVASRGSRPDVEHVIDWAAGAVSSAVAAASLASGKPVEETLSHGSKSTV